MAPNPWFSSYPPRPGALGPDRVPLRPFPLVSSLESRPFGRLFALLLILSNDGPSACSSLLLSSTLFSSLLFSYVLFSTRLFSFLLFLSPFPSLSSLPLTPLSFLFSSSLLSSPLSSPIHPSSRPFDSLFSAFLFCFALFPSPFGPPFFHRFSHSSRLFFVPSCFIFAVKSPKNEVKGTYSLVRLSLRGWAILFSRWRLTLPASCLTPTCRPYTTLLRPVFSFNIAELTYF